MLAGPGYGQPYACSEIMQVGTAIYWYVALTTSFDNVAKSQGEGPPWYCIAWRSFLGVKRRDIDQLSDRLGCRRIIAPKAPTVSYIDERPSPESSSL